MQTLLPILWLSLRHLTLLFWVVIFLPCPTLFGMLGERICWPLPFNETLFYKNIYIYTHTPYGLTSKALNYENCFWCWKTKSLHTSYWSNYWSSLSPGFANNKSTNIVVEVISAKKPLLTIIFTSSIAFDVSLCRSNPRMIVLYVQSLGGHPFPSIFSRNSLASSILIYYLCVLFRLSTVTHCY